MIPPTVTAVLQAIQEKGVLQAIQHIVKGKIVHYVKPEVKAAHDKLCGGLYRFRPDKPYTGGVRLVVENFSFPWCFPRGKHRNGEYRTTRPDTDNLNKLLKDCGTNIVCTTELGFWKDDAQVASEVIEKFWAEIPGIWIRMEEL